MANETAKMGAGDKVLRINDKDIVLKDLGSTTGGRHRLKAQIYVSGIGQVFLTAYAVEKEIGAVTPRRGRPPGSKNKATTEKAEMLAMLAELNNKVAELSKGAQVVPVGPTQEELITSWNERQGKKA